LKSSRESYEKGTRGQARASTTDPDARQMKMADGGFRPAFDGQVSVDVSSGIIVDVTATNRGTDDGLCACVGRRRFERRCCGRC